MNMREILEKRFIYPFPDLISPYAAVLQEITNNQWIDGELKSLLSEKDREKYKRTNTGYMSARWWPTTPTLERLIPLGRFMLWSLYNDDIYEQGTLEEIRHVQACSIAILKGGMSAGDAGIPLGAFLASLREELMAFIPQSSIIRFADKIDEYFDGVEMEAFYKKARMFPTPGNHKIIRERGLMIRAFVESIEVETGVTLPPEVHIHPVIRQMSRLVCRITGYFNDVQSLFKDELTGDIHFNLVKILEHHLRITKQEALDAVIQIHNRELEEFLLLQRNLPDFGKWQQDVENYVHHMSLFLTGWQSVSLKETQRYWEGGFPAPEALHNVTNDWVKPAPGS